jgi:hypothetical protein
VDEMTFKSWRKKLPALEDAFNQGKKLAEMSFQEYVYNRLPSKLKTTWDKITEWDDHPNATRRIYNLLCSHGIRARQQLFIHALINKNFNVSRALESMCMSKQQLFNWTKTDPNFSELLDEIEWHRKNFYEDKLFDLVKEGNAAATIFVNRTKNRDRGYGNKIEVEHTGNISHSHKHVIDLESLNLPLELRKQILNCIEESQMKALPAPKTEFDTDAIDVPFEEVVASTGDSFTDSLDLLPDEEEAA